MSIGVDTTSGTDNRMDGIAQGVVNSQVDNQIEETARRSVAQILSVNSMEIIWLVVDAITWYVSPMPVGVETGAGTDNGMYGVAQSVVNREVNNKVVKTAAGSVAVMLSVNALIEIPNAIGVETGAGTDNRMNGVAKGVVHRQIYDKIMEAPRIVVAQMLCINTLEEITHSVGVETGTGTDNGMYGVAYGVIHRKVYNKVVVTS